MINTGDFNVTNRGNVLLPRGLVPLDKCKLVHTTIIPQSTGERFSSPYAIQTSLNAYTNDNKLPADIKSVKTNDIHLVGPQVHVQCIQSHPTLQNKKWSSTGCSFNNERVRNVNRIESAFILSKTASGNNINNTTYPNTLSNVECDKSLNIGNPMKSIQEAIAHRELSDRHMTSVSSIDYQENAFHHIEDVHNYAKMDRYSYSNESSNSSMHEDDNEDEDADLDEDDDAATNYERYVNKSKYFAAKNGKCEKANTLIIRMETEETDLHVDVETVHQVQKETEVAVPSTPDHHARRPMNAFLIFCKRHRAIVKERYKTLENRAITKILGDWWASLDATDKKCFTNLAQQNKDAFFNANPNFKWYKLPAPPLRTLSTRPGNVGRKSEQDYDFKLNMMAVQSGVSLLPKFPKNSNHNLFKLADEAHMGELSHLFNTESNNNMCNANQNTLQQVLGETSQFINAYMLPINGTGGDQESKKRLLSENSFSSNGSEDDTLPKKSSRSCKGKIYQELINSGKISAVSKKIKGSKSQHHLNGFSQQYISTNHSSTQASLDGSKNPTTTWANMPIYKSKSKISESSYVDSSQSNYDVSNFDLEEKIKELPALSLDLYLQRKRNTKKKKKFTSKKRHSNNILSSRKSGANNVMSASPLSATDKNRDVSPQQAVGSQKRKARKESITRRDITAIENEIASVISLANGFNTVHGCYYLNESLNAPVPKTMVLGEPTISTVGMEADNQHSHQFGNLYNDNSSTSDLFILAEVAANRTELTN
uniref:HMG box transcription factor BBX n=1 Tax=Ceratitis capitata TaxID=7213 RepID=W8BAB1_CERCA